MPNPQQAERQDDGYDAAPTQPLPTDRATTVEYPAYVRDREACLQTLGAPSGDLQRALQADAKSLSLHFRPDDPTGHPMDGTRAPTTNLLLRVRRRKQPAGCGADAAEAPVEAKIVAVLDHAYHFDGLADFQYTHTGQNDGLAAGAAEGLLDVYDSEPAPEGGASCLLNLPPPTFTRIQTVHDYAFKPNPNTPRMIRSLSAAHLHSCPTRHVLRVVSTVCLEFSAPLFWKIFALSIQAH